MERRLGNDAQSLEQTLRTIERDPHLMKRIRTAVQTPGNERLINKWKCYLERRGVDTEELLARIMRSQG